MNLFTGLSTNEIISFFLSLGEFGTFVILEALALALFYAASRPRYGRIATAAIWHFAAACLLLVAIVTTVWSAPAQKSFLDDATTSHLFPFTTFDLSWRFWKVVIGVAIAVIAIVCMVIGTSGARSQRRRIAEEANL